MSDGQRIFTTVFTYMSYWLFLGALYLLLTGIMQIINVVFHFEQNQWLVGFIVLVIVMNHAHAKKATREVIEKMEEEEKWAVKEIRDLWLKEYKEDKDKWFNDTINKLYIKGRDVSWL